MADGPPEPPPSSDQRLANILGALALALNDDMMAELADCLPPGIPAAAVALVGHAPWITIAELAQALRLSHSATVRLVDRACAADLLMRARSERDGRAVVVRPTAKGRTVAARIAAARLATVEHFLTALDREERASLSGMVERMLIGGLRDGMHGVRICRLCEPKVCDDCPIEPHLPQR
jgi:DNA-binding MarR family transcriptional regulator